MPDKDADGLDAGVIVHKTLVALGLPQEKIEVHLLAKHASVHDETERAAMLAKSPSFIVGITQVALPCHFN